VTLEQLKTKHRNEFARFNSYRDNTPEELARLSYGDFDPITDEIKETDFYLPTLMSGSDYSGESVTVSNHRVFLDEFKALNQTGIWDVYGGHGTYAVAIRVSAITESMLEVFEQLENYPLISEEDHSEVEMEAEQEAWDSWTRHDFKRLLIEKFPHLEEKIDAMPDDGGLWRVLAEGMERANEYWIHETGNNAFVRLERVIEHITEQDITN